MKIIGQTGNQYNNVFIVQIPEDEAYNLIGHSSSYGASKKLQVGDTIKVKEMFGRLVDMKQKEAELEKSAAVLRAAADLIEKALPAVHRANTKEKAEQEEKGETTT